MRTILVIRHAQSTANVTEAPYGMTAEDLAFADESAGLTPKGEKQCEELAPKLLTEYGVNTRSTRVAVSEFVRTQKTAELLGFAKGLTTPNPVLDEVDHGMELGALRAMLRQNKIPRVAVEVAKETLRQAPSEGVWVAHGLLIAGLCIELGTVDQYEQPIPRQCEVRRLTF